MQKDSYMMPTVTKKRKQSESTMKNDDAWPATSLPNNDISATSENCWCTVETMLAVPLEYIFRDVSMISTDISVGWSPATPRSNTFQAKHPTNDTTNHRSKPLLSRIEAQLFLQVNTLSYEMDALTSVSVTALQQRVQCREFSTSLQRTDHPYLRPIVSVLHAYHETMPNVTIQQVSKEMKDRIIPEFQHLIRQLRQFSEQNWTLADTLDDGQPNSNAGYHNLLANEKRKLSDLQEEVCQRIEGLLQESVVDDIAGSAMEQLSMKDYCDQLFQQQNDVIENSENNMDVIVHHDANQPENISKAPDGNVDDADDEVLDEAPDRSLTATPISSPEESPTLIQATAATRASILRNTTIKTSSPLAALAATTVPRTSKPHNPIAEQHATTSTNSTSTTFQHPQRQLEKSFGSLTTAAESPEENEKENEPSQSSSQRSAVSLSSTQTTIKRQRIQQHPASSESPPQPLVPTTTTALSGLNLSHGMELETSHVTGEEGHRLNISVSSQRQSMLATSTRTEDNDDDDDGDEDEIIEEKEVFRTQSAAEVLSTFATTTLRRSSID